MENCEKFQVMMSLYIDSQLNKQEQNELFDHLGECEQCREELLLLQSVIKDLNETEFLPLPEGYHEELMDKFSEEKVKYTDLRKGNHWKKYSAIAAAFLVVIVVGVLGRQATYNYSNEKGAYSGGGSMSNVAMQAPTKMMTTTDVYEDSGTWVGAEMAMEESEIAPDFSNEKSINTIEPEMQRKKIKTASISLEVENFDEFINLVETYVESSQGYVEDYNSYIYYEDESNKLSLKAGYLRTRVDEGIYNSVLDYIKTLGKVESENEYINDVTSSYVDVKARLEVKTSEEQRLLELLSQAETIEDIIVIEARLSEVREYIESYEAQLKSWDKQVDYSTIEINVREKQPTVVSGIDASFGEKIKDSFVKSVNLVIDGSQNLVSLLVMISIPVLTLVIVIGLIIALVKTILKRKR